MTYENTVDYQDLHWRQIRYYCATFAINERQFKISKKMQSEYQTGSTITFARSAICRVGDRLID